MRIGQEALDLVGMPDCHGKKFLEVAEQEQTIIISRAPGIYATKLIEEGYATKGFHNKSKSCNWGPMAGFVNTNPLFSKAGLSAKEQPKQKDRIDEAIKKYGAQSTQIIISEARRLELINDLKLLKDVSSGTDAQLNIFKEMNKLGDLNPRCYKYSPIMTHVSGEYVATAKKYRFFLKERFLRTSPHESSWASAFTDTSLPKLWEVYYAENDTTYKFLPVESFVDPNFKKVKMRDYMSDRIIHKYATTADFDLFVTWPDLTELRKQIQIYLEEGKNYEANLIETASKKLDMRPASTFTLFSYSETEKHEDSEVGNITPRLTIINAKLNNRFRLGCGYQMGNLIHHSDEAGRPHIDDIDYPMIAFLPKGNALAQHYGSQVVTLDGATNKGDKPTDEKLTLEFKDFVDRAIAANFRVGLNPGWVKVLGTKYRDYAIPSDPTSNPFYKYHEDSKTVTV
ncbi:hypothetical protein BKI52_13450 [marine bacterium AO1-C]|nr:hypothetical protein BKI52_13450 [marine bacterium AO1-C]